MYTVGPWFGKVCVVTRTNALATSYTSYDTAKAATHGAVCQSIRGESSSRAGGFTLRLTCRRWVPINLLSCCLWRAAVEERRDCTRRVHNNVQWDERARWIHTADYYLVFPPFPHYFQNGLVLSPSRYQQGWTAEKIKASLPARVLPSQHKKLMSDATKICGGGHPASVPLFRYYQEVHKPNTKEFFTPDRLSLVSL